mmetsp:Transcript_42724/g.83769  ORF Transcript_42724/g.83769 Transcript_42724/m.83769 type:complete len:211 (-) Transcript_42724:1189-1821(-)
MKMRRTATTHHSSTFAAVVFAVHHRKRGFAALTACGALRHLPVVREVCFGPVFALLFVVDACLLFKFFVMIAPQESRECICFHQPVNCDLCVVEQDAYPLPQIDLFLFPSFSDAFFDDSYRSLHFIDKGRGQIHLSAGAFGYIVVNNRFRSLQSLFVTNDVPFAAGDCVARFLTLKQHRRLQFSADDFAKHIHLIPKVEIFATKLRHQKP